MDPLKIKLKTIRKSEQETEAQPGSPRQATPRPHPLQPGTWKLTFLEGNPFLEPKLEAKARSSQATAVREVAESCRKLAICLDFKEGVYKYIWVVPFFAG